ncbi:WYL domain-containing protein, partial [Oscillatoriales cyanobacterium LEGE 11467]|nr:WYL domain-containing protein [Zarconia navalis LEGE 11467]
MKSASTTQLAFALEILKRLAEKPYKRRELADELEIFLQQRGEKPGDVVQKLDRTIAKLRECGFEIDSTSHSPYVLRESNFPLILSPEQRQALGMAVQFLANMGFSAEAGHLLRLGKFPDVDRLSPVKVDFSPPVDYSEHRIPGIVEALQQRFDRQCRYTIRYRNTQGKERLWDLDRSELRLHEGTLYLFAYVPDLNSYN